ncbi:UPF0262 family protein [Brevundimonas sp. NPDC092305]|uniref:UPF0262 family protein n=1 Tax=Brevundimonas sp. NPDC092305 TaxID=3363957 RepID=UPI0037F3E856
MSDHRLSSVELDSSLPAPNVEIESDRQRAMADLIGSNTFEPEGAERGPYALKMSSQDGRLVLDITGPDFARTHGLSMSSLNKVIRDYIEICDSYYEALRGTSASKIEAVDMGRRGLHNDGADLLRSRLNGKVTLDHETARRLFTLVTALYRR